MSLNISFGALPPRTKQISHKLIIGARQQWSGLKMLQKEENVSCVIDLRNRKGYKQFFEKLFCKFVGLKYINFPIELAKKNKISPEIFNKIFELIQNNKNGKTFVHCNSGIHRSLFVAAMVKFRDGAIKTKQEFCEFLQNNDFYKLKKKVRCGFKIALTPEERKIRIDNLNYQLQEFWKILQKK